MNTQASIPTRRTATWLAALALSAASLPGVAGEFVTVDYPGAVETRLTGVTNAGTASGFAAMPDESLISFTYDLARRTFKLLPTPPGGYNFAATGINARGTLVGSLEDTPDSTIGAILSKQGTYTTFDVPGFAFDSPRAVADSGLVTGYASTEAFDDWTGFLFDPKRQGFTLFDVPGSLQIIAQGINGRGFVVGSAAMPPGTVFQGSAPGRYGFLRSRNGAITLFRVNGLPTSARGINDAGMMTGFVDLPGGVRHAFTAPRPAGGAYVDIVVPASALFAVPGATATFPQAIDNRGRVVGGYDNASGFVYLPD